MDCSLGELMHYMIRGEKADFYARILSGMRREFSTRIPVACVSLYKNLLTLQINPKWWETASLREAIAVIHHEAFHVILDHMSRAMRAFARYSNVPPQILLTKLYIAEDLAANSLLLEYSREFSASEIRKLGCVPGEGIFKEFPKKKSMETYLDMLIKSKETQDFIEYLKGFKEGFKKGLEENQRRNQGQNQDQDQDQNQNQNQNQDQDQDQNQKSQGQEDQGQGQEGQGQGQGQNQSPYDKGFQDGMTAAKNPNRLFSGSFQHDDDSLTEMTLEEILGIAAEVSSEVKQNVKRAFEEHKKNRGRLPGEVSELVEDIIETKIPWHRLIRDMAVTSQRESRRRTNKRMRRRHASITALSKFPGRTKDRHYNICFIIDTSGSMGSDELSLAIGQLQGIQKGNKNVRITVIEADVSVHKVYEIGPNDKVDTNFKGRGGTSFNLGLAEAKKHNPDVCFYFTDGYGDSVNKENQVSCPFAWVVTPGGKIPDENYGRVIWAE